MSFPRYPNYKPSGVEWLGEVPEHWDVNTLRRCAINVRTGGTPASQPPSCDLEQGYVWYTPGDFGDSLRLTTSARLIPAAAIESGEVRIFPPRSVLIVSIGATLGKVGFSEGESSANQQINAVIPNKRIDGYFLAFSLSIKVEEMRFLSNASTIGIMNQEKTKEIWLTVPPHLEQLHIAAFLDRETAKIDALVAEQQRLIELLKEKRQAVISHAVTKGLDPTVPMKPSGIEWLGDIPAHWEIRRLKHISPFIAVGIVVNPSTFIADEGLPFIYGGDIREGVIDWVNARRISESSSQENGKTKLRSGDLLTVRVGAPGVTAVVPPECDGGNCASVMLIRRGLFNSHWLCYLMNTRIVRFQVEVVQYGAAQEQFNIAHAVNFWMPTPPQTEQDKIVDYLESETEKFDTLTADAERAIELLQERRTALISAAVTGQIDVRQLAQGVAA